MTMKKYIGVKMIEAELMTRGEYNKFKGWTIPENENPHDAGWLVKYSDDYISWSPRQAFDEAYRPIDNLTFGYAVEVMKLGKRVARLGWNGKGMWLMLCIPEGDYTLESTGETYGRLPYIYMKTADNKLVPWTASQTDIFTDDWCVVE